MPLHFPDLHFFPPCVVAAVVTVVAGRDGVVALLDVVIIVVGVVVVIIMEAKVSLRQPVELQQLTEQLVREEFLQLMEQEALQLTT